MGVALTLISTLFVLSSSAASAQPAQDEAVVTVHTAGTRQASGDVSPLAGVTLQLFDSEGSDTPRSEDWATCVSGAAGICAFTVPIGAGGVPADTRLWIGQPEDGAPDGWYTNTELRTGPGAGENSVRQPYRYRTPELDPGGTYDSADFMTSDPLGNAVSGGIWQNSLNNPPLPDVCGLDVALLMDFSGSVGEEVDDLKGAADTMVDALVGTPSSMAVYSFASSSPAEQGENHPELVPVATQDEADAFKELYADWGSEGGTNWDVAAQTVAEGMAASGGQYDLTVMITDGNPTFHGDRQGPGSTTRVVEVENGVLSANELKDVNSRLLVAGVGDGIDAATELNLRAMSGPVGFDPDAGNIANTDYLHVDDFAEVGRAIQELLAELCSGSVSVTKYIVPQENEGDDVTGAEQAGSGWTFDAEAVTPDGAVVTPESATTDDTGTVNFDIDYPAADDTVTLRVTEQQQDGYVLVTPDGQNATCFVSGTGEELAPEKGDTGPNPVFSVDVSAQQAVNCNIYNKEAPELAELTVDKRWEIDGYAVTHEDRPDGFDASLELSEPGSDPAEPTPQDWGTARPGYAVDSTATGSEDVTAPPGCTVDGVVMARGDDLDNPAPVDPGSLEFDLYAPSSGYTITNEVSCDTELTLVKTVDNTGGGTAAPEDWTLTADGPTLVEGSSGSGDVTAVSVQPGDYELGENGPGGYEPSDWTCLVGDGQAPVNDGQEVAVGLGQQVTCTVHNVFQPGPGPSPSPSPEPSPSPDPTPSPEPSPSPSPDPEPAPDPTPEQPPTDKPKLPVTGASVGGLVGTAALLLIAGALAIAIVWQRRTNSDT